MTPKKTISIIGLGYVGLPIAVAFAKHCSVIGFDKNSKRIEELKQAYDKTNEIDETTLKQANIKFSNNPNDLKAANFHIIAVPTPIDNAKKPNMGLVFSASEIVGQHLKPEDIVVYESTVYPGATEEECIPILEKFSGLKSNKDFFVGYSPERINPGDKKHTLATIIKIVSAQNDKTLEDIANTYSMVVKAGVYKASSIRVAEAAKVIENTQRDLNIALMNELAMIFNRMDIDTHEVLEAANTKWNFLPFKPGLVGGHCIGVDPYYLTYKAEQYNLHPEVILAGRRINDNMGKFIAEQTIKQMISKGSHIAGEKVIILGLTFKENCKDIRNTRTIDIINELKNYGVEPIIHDPLADPDEAKKEYGIKLTSWDNLPTSSAIVLAVAHQHYLQHLTTKDILSKLSKNGVIIDIKSVLSPKEFNQNGVSIWRI